MTQEGTISRLPLYIGLTFLLLIVGAEVAAILALNDGLLVYVMDDPYIHLALAENLLRGHYGINLQEFSAPSSSILWPFILAPFTSWIYFPLLFNLIAASATVWYFSKVLNYSIQLQSPSASLILHSGLLILLILTTNLVGLIFTGMEHSLQILTVSMIIFGLIYYIENQRIPAWLPLVIALAPLVRYENMAVSGAAMLFLFLHKEYKRCFLSATFIIIPVIGFSVFLNYLGLDILPTSVNAKSSVVETGGTLHSLIANIKNSLMIRQGAIIAMGGGILLAFFFFESQHSKKILAGVMILAIGAHIVAGQYGWGNRYEIYIWTALVLVILYLSGQAVSTLLETKPGNASALKWVTVVASVFIAATSPSMKGLTSLPFGSNNIYQQQYQMHRFATEFYNKSVAVNDIGYVAYQNPNYVLDLAGLASQEVLQLRHGTKSATWMDELTKKNNIELVMIYDAWFNSIPEQWEKIGELHLGRPIVTTNDDTVAFYATNHKAYEEILELTKSFSQTLPKGVVFELK